MRAYGVEEARLSAEAREPRRHWPRPVVLPAALAVVMQPARRRAAGGAGWHTRALKWRAPGVRGGSWHGTWAAAGTRGLLFGLKPFSSVAILPGVCRRVSVNALCF